MLGNTRKERPSRTGGLGAQDVDIAIEDALCLASNTEPEASLLKWQMNCTGIKEGSSIKDVLNAMWRSRNSTSFAAIAQD